MDLDKVILNILNNKASKEEYEMLEAWRNESQENLDFLNTMKEKAGVGEGTYHEYNKEAAWNKVDAKVQVEDHTSTSASSKWPLILMLALLIGSLVYYFAQEKNSPKSFKTNLEMEQFASSDNSLIWLNANSEVAEVADFEKSREVDLIGEAYFEVVSNPDNPFIINLNDTEYIKVLGTSFNVLNRGKDFDIAVYSGHVQLHVLDRVIDLYKNDRVKKVKGSYVKIKNTDQNVLSWKNKILVFDNESLTNVIDELEDYYNVDISLSDNLDGSKCSLRTRFENATIETVFEELKSHFNLKYTRDQNKFTITSLNCGS